MIRRSPVLVNRIACHWRIVEVDYDAMRTRTSIEYWGSWGDATFAMNATHLKLEWTAWEELV